MSGCSEAASGWVGEQRNVLERCCLEEVEVADVLSINTLRQEGPGCGYVAR